jgi:trehalose 6-phosphate phosphatase
VTPGIAAPLERTAICLDYDGTIAPIVPDPEVAAPLEGMVELLGRLAGRAAVVALVSGRPAAFLAANAKAPGLRYYGLYGLEEIRDGELVVDPAVLEVRPAVRAALKDVEADPAVRDSGAYIEDKGNAVGIHLRRVADPERWSDEIAATANRIAERYGLEVQPGRLVWELRPAVRRDKGDAVRKVLAETRPAAVLVAGDDLGDLPAFAAAESARADGVEVLRVAVRSAEAPPDLLANADLAVDGPEGLRALLASLEGGAALPPRCSPLGEA